MSSRYSVALEQQADLARWLQGSTGQRYLDYWLTPKEVGGTVQDARNSKRVFTGSVLAACAGEPYFWTAEMCDLLIHASKGLPELRLTESILPSRAGYFWFDRPLPMPGATAIVGDRQVAVVDGLRGIGWCDATWAASERGSRGIGLVSVLLDDPKSDKAGVYWREGGIPAGSTTWMYGETPSDIWYAHAIRAEQPGGKGYAWDSDDYENRFIAMTYYAATAFLLLTQKVFVRQKEAPDRLARKRVARPRDINVIYLRRAANMPPRGEGESEVDWNYRWFSSAHWRRYQNHIKLDQPKWISGCIKGPDDKPLKMPPPDRLFAVTR